MKRSSKSIFRYIQADTGTIKTKVNVPDNPQAVVIICDDKEQGENLTRNELVSQIFMKENYLTLQILNEEVVCNAEQLLPSLLKWLSATNEFKNLPVFIFCSGRSANNIFKTILIEKLNISAIAIRSGIIELSPKELNKINIPVLLLTADGDYELLDKNNKLLGQVNNNFRMRIISNSTRYFVELGKLGYVLFLTIEWFRNCLHRKALSI